MPTPTDHVHCTVLRETDKAYLLRDQDDPKREAYFPKSQVSFARRNVNTGEAIAIIPLWLLKEKQWMP